MYRLSIAVAILTIFVGWLELSWTVALLCTFLIYLASGGWRFARIFCLTFPRDCGFMFLVFKSMREGKKFTQNNQTVGDIFQETAQKHSDKVAFIFEDKQWTFKEVDLFSNKVANYFQNIGYKKGDVVALFMENRPEMVFFWLGLIKIGVVASLVNYNLRKESLSYCISIVKSKGIIYSSDPNIADAIADIHSSIEDIELFEFGATYSNGLTSKNILEKLEKCSQSPPSTESYEKSCGDIFLYLYTSGTTGFPKVCVVRHMRMLIASSFVSNVFNYGSSDVMYCVLPIYHALAIANVITATLRCGVTTVVRRKFSASRFWEDCIHYKATCALYVGELCRYLLAQPPKETDKMHTLRFIHGNGLRPQIWDEFKKRFNISLIAEMYGASEGNIGFLNYVGYPGAIGFLPVVLSGIFPTKIFKMDPLTTELCRGPDGFCIPCKPGEVGQVAGKIVTGDAIRRFDGYTDKTATEKKIACDVMKKGDRWFLSGDSLVYDELGYVYFHDRLGDTYRWRGENVSSAEVESIITKVLGLVSLVVYGVQIPGCEGRAGMAAIEDPDDAIDIKFLGSKLPEVLPSYAQPVFLRIAKSVDVTGTFRFQKSKLREEGFNLSIVKDKLFYLDQNSSDYRVLTEEIYQKFQDGEMRV